MPAFIPDSSTSAAVRLLPSVLRLSVLSQPPATICTPPQSWKAAYEFAYVQAGSGLARQYAGAQPLDEREAQQTSTYVPVALDPTTYAVALPSLHFID